MQIVEYTPERFELLRKAGEAAGNPSLQHRPFVDYYYATSPFSRMYLFCNDTGEVIGTIGIDRLLFRYRDRDVRLLFSNNYHALKPGAGGLLYLHWMKGCEPTDLGVVFGGSDDTHEILRKQKWTYYEGVKTLLLNWPWESQPGDAPWRRAAKAAARFLQHRPLRSYAGRLPPFASGIEIREEPVVSAEMLPACSPFVFRFAPSLEYLNWRYATNLSFVRYRVFRILSGSATRGYVIVTDMPGKLVVAQCDADDVRALASGVLKAILAAASRDSRPRTAMLACSHRDMLNIYREFGFRAAVQERSWVLGAYRRPVDINADTSEWLINFDIGDNCLRYPFLDSPDA